MFYILSLLLALSVEATRYPARNSHDHQGRQILPCAVPCGSGWCCDSYTACEASNGAQPFVCVDQLLTKSDGTPQTWSAFDNGGFESDVTSINSFLSSYSLTVTAVASTGLTSTAPTTTTISSRGTSTMASVATTAASTAAAAAAERAVGILEGVAVMVLVNIGIL